ncbi:hypothetical protein ACFL32_00750 [Candidatus Neomarinimicrobiota bacterium]
MFNINLLAKPGLQGEILVPEGAVMSKRELKVISRLEARAPEDAVQAEATPVTRGRRTWLWVLLIIVLSAVAVWYFQGWQLAQDLLLPFREESRIREQKVFRAPLGKTSVSVMASFLEDLPEDAVVDYADAEVGLLIYRIWGQEMNQDLLRLNSAVEGHCYSDLLPPVDTTNPGFWHGTIVFNAPGQEGALRPLKEEYERFFLKLQHLVSETGGAVVRMIPGTMSTGEYVLSGSIGELQAHLNMIDQDTVNVHYHRLSLLNQTDTPDGNYLLHVVFNIIEGRLQSPLASLQESTGV